jgi:hypothetical protein
MNSAPASMRMGLNIKAMMASRSRTIIGEGGFR